MLARMAGGYIDERSGASFGVAPEGEVRMENAGKLEATWQIRVQPGPKLVSNNLVLAPEAEEP